MALLFLPILCFSLTFLTSAAQGGGGGATLELWCVAKNNAQDADLQTALDWACGPGGANCTVIQQGGLCYDPGDILNAASFAFNDYYLHHGMTQESCYFDNTAALTSLNPSHGNCIFPSSKTVGNGNSTGSVPGGLGPYVTDDSSSNSSRKQWIWSLVIIHFLHAILLHLCG